MMNIGIIGNGFVGKATQLINNHHINMMIYDILSDKCNPPGLKLSDLKECDLIFIALPTPMDTNGSCHIEIIFNVVSKLNSIIDPFKTNIVIRSTVPPGTSRKLNAYFMPEFLTEKNWEQDFINCNEWIFGLKDTSSDFEFKNKIINLFTYAYKENKIKSLNLNFVTLEEAELAKYARNCFLATKVSFFNEIAEFSREKNINYDNVQKLVAMDPRIGISHTNVPGSDGKFGYGGTCFPKDTNALVYEMNKIGMKSYILKSVVDRNENVDRPEKDWNQFTGRAVVQNI